MSEACVQVAVRVRPLLPREVLHHHKVCVRVVPDSSQVMLGSDRLFCFDHAFGPTASQDEVYKSCVKPMVESVVDGYNATVFCYGQTGSGKTFTLGGGQQDEQGGIIDHVAQDLFSLLEERTKSHDGVEVSVHASFMELYMEELRDLLELHTIPKELHIREDKLGNTVVVGAKEVVVASVEELFSILEMGNAMRHTAATGMNDHSSRSHAILTLQVILCCHNNNNNSLRSVRSSKICLVDLAGSERAGKTGNTGTRFKESAHINTGLLALGNVIRALSDHVQNPRRNSCIAHIPYRDAKITRLLRDSLGGTAHTLMVACVSPSNHFVAETLSVLQFASKARHIRNNPRQISAQTEVKPTWHPSEGRLWELEYEVQTLRELLKKKNSDDLRDEMDRKMCDARGDEGDGLTQYSQFSGSETDKKMNKEKLCQYRLLIHEAALLLADIPGPSPSFSFRQRVQDWQERMTAVSHSHQTDNKDCSEGGGDQSDYITTSKLKEELNKCQEALQIEEQLLEQKDSEVRQVRKEAEQLLQELKTRLKASEEERERTRIQTEQLVNQQILIDRLRSDLMTFQGKTLGAKLETEASGYSGKRPHSVPPIRQSCAHRPPRKIHSSPPAYSLERVMAVFKMRGHLLLAEIEEKAEVYCPFIKQQPNRKDGEQEEEDENDDDLFRIGFRHSLNRTWTSRQKTSALKAKNTEQDQTSVKNPDVHQPQRAAGTKESQLIQSHMSKARTRAGVTERRIQELSVNMRMKEELIKELDKTDKETKAVDRHGRHGDDRETGVLARLSMQSQQIRAEVYHSLQQMKLQREQLKTSLRQQRKTRDNNEDLDQNGEQSERESTVFKGCYLSSEKLHDRSWLEEEEEQVLQKRAELQDLEEELRRREEVLQHREACLQQKNKLEIKMLRSSQALNQDLLHVSVQLESIEEQLQSQKEVRKTEGVTIEELQKERDMLIKRRDTLDDQLRDNRVLSVEEEHNLFQLEEAIEALDAALEFKNQAIEDKQKKLFILDSSSHQSQCTEPAQLCDVIRKLKRLSFPETLELLIKYFNKVVCLREVECQLRLHCEELELHAGEQEVELRKMEAAMQRLALDTDRRLTQQHRDHQNNIQLLIQLLCQKLQEGVSGEAQQAIQERTQHLEKELFFYKSSSRQLKKKLKELLSDSQQSDNQPSHTPEHRQMHSIHESANEPKTHTEEAQTRVHVVTTCTNMHAEEADKNTHFNTDRHIHQTQSPSSSLALRKPKIPEGNQTPSQSQGRYVRGKPGENVEMTPVRLPRRELRQISAADLQVPSSAMRRRQPIVDTSPMFEDDSIEVDRNTDR